MKGISQHAKWNGVVRTSKVWSPLKLPLWRISPRGSSFRILLILGVSQPTIENKNIKDRHYIVKQKFRDQHIHLCDENIGRSIHNKLNLQFHLKVSGKVGKNLRTLNLNQRYMSLKCLADINCLPQTSDWQIRGGIYQ